MVSDTLSKYGWKLKKKYLQMTNLLERKHLILYGAIILGSGTLLAVLDGREDWLAGWLGYSLVILLSTLVIFLFGSR